jgi:hypothetical protein
MCRAIGDRVLSVLLAAGLASRAGSRRACARLGGLLAPSSWCVAAGAECPGRQEGVWGNLERGVRGAGGSGFPQSAAWYHFLVLRSAAGVFLTSPSDPLGVGVRSGTRRQHGAQRVSAGRGRFCAGAVRSATDVDMRRWQNVWRRLPEFVEPELLPYAGPAGRGARSGPSAPSGSWSEQVPADYVFVRFLLRESLTFGVGGHRVTGFGGWRESRCYGIDGVGAALPSG